LLGYFVVQNLLALKADGRDARGGAKLFRLFDDEHFDWLAAGHEFEAKSVGGCPLQSIKI
jgi:hypothetical protein